MITKTMLVFYDANCLPFKDKERTIHFPILGGGFLGASNTTHIRFYIDQIGTPNDTWVAMAKLPNGKIGYKILSTYLDSELNENYAELVVENWFTQAKGDVYISLQGYEGGVQLNYNSETQLYEVNGTPTIQATGSVKLTIMYATSLPENTDMVISLSDVLALAGDKLDTDKGIVVIANTSVSVSGYDDNQIFYCLADNSVYKKVSGALSLIFTCYSKTESDNKYVAKVNTTNIVYGTNNSGEQYSVPYSTDYSGKGYNIVQRDSDAQIKVPTTPTSNNDSASKSYVDTQRDTRVEKTTSSYKIYATDELGQQTTLDYDQDTDGKVVRRDENGHIYVQNPNANGQATPKQYVDNGLNLKANASDVYTKSQTYTKAETDSAIAIAVSSAYIYKGTKTVAEINALDTSDLVVGWVYNVSDSGTITLGSLSVNAGDNIAWTGSAWDILAGVVDLSDYYTKTESDSKYVDLTNAQTITGAKTFKGDLKFVGASYTSEGVLTTDNSYAYLGFGGANTLFAFNGSRFLSNNVSGTDLGASNRFWKDLYLNGELKDGTYSIAIANIQTKITSTNKLASDLVDSTNQTNQFANDVGLSVVSGKLCITYEE